MKVSLLAVSELNALAKDKQSSPVFAIQINLNISGKNYKRYVNSYKSFLSNLPTVDASNCATCEIGVYSCPCFGKPQAR